MKRMAHRHSEIVNATDLGITTWAATVDSNLPRNFGIKFLAVSSSRAVPKPSLKTLPVDAL